MIKAKEAAAITQEVNDEVDKLIKDITTKAYYAASGGKTSININLRNIDSRICRIATDYLKNILGYSVSFTFEEVYSIYWSSYNEDIEDNDKFITANTCFSIVIRVKSTIDNLLKTLNDKIICCAENGASKACLNVQWYTKDVLSAARDFLLSLEYNVEYEEALMIVSW